ncbi:hypothetical protein RUM43_010095 [Polyplax serrata]|uniref:Uncharacterized protein n=1 Tax=Polyplax serrata TaxID=468196 RepID=A0AAN8P714_POLSC
MYKFIKLFSRPNATGGEAKCKSQNEAIPKRKSMDKSKHIEKTKSNSSENLLAISVPKRNVNSVDNLGETNYEPEKKNKECAVSLESVFTEDNEGRRTSPRTRMLKAPSSSNILLLKKEAERKPSKTSSMKTGSLRNLSEPKVNELKR